MFYRTKEKRRKSIFPGKRKTEEGNRTIGRKERKSRENILK